MKDNAEKFVSPISERAIRISKNFDQAAIEKDATKLEAEIREAEYILCEEDEASQAHLYYSLGTAYDELVELTGNDEEKGTEKILYCFRRSIEIIESERFNDKAYLQFVSMLKKNLYTNYANVLERCGRKIAAIEQYKKALSVCSDFGMAFGNLGCAYQYYGFLDYDVNHCNLLHNFAYRYLQKAIESEDPNVYEDAKKSFKAAIESYPPEYIENVLNSEWCSKPYEYADPEELAYREWCLVQGLFLNTLNDLPIVDLSFAGDVLQLPDMLVDVDDGPIFHGMFSQLKQEYIYARYLYYSTFFSEKETHFADKETYILSHTDYAQYSIRLEKLKTAFKTLYGMFDKIAYFLEHYYDLGMRENHINFHSIWQESAGYGKGKYAYKNTLKPKDNIALRALYWLSKDFFEKFDASPNPALTRIKDIRNALEHKYVKIYDPLITGYTEEYGDGLALYISEEEMYDITMQLLKIIREAIINLSLSVNIAEVPKRKEAKGKVAIPIRLMNYEDDWKV